MKKFICSFLIIFVLFCGMLFFNGFKVYASTEDDVFGDSGVETNINNDYLIETASSDGDEEGYYWENTGLGLPKEVDYGDETLLKYLKKGDIIFEAMSATNHAAIVEGIFYDETYGQYYVRVVESIKDGGVCRGIVTPDRMKTKEGSVYRLNNASEEQINGAFEFMYDQLGEDYQIATHKNYNDSNKNWYCSELIWAAFYHQGILLDVDDNDLFGSIVWPSELVNHDFAIKIASFEYETNCTRLDNVQHKIECDGDEIIDTHNYVPYNGYTDICYGCGLLSSENTVSHNMGILNCRSNDISQTRYCDTGQYLLFQINIDCAKNYSFDITAFSCFDVSLYNSNQDLVNIDVNIGNNGLTVNFAQYLNEDIYYLRIKLIDIVASANVIVNVGPTWQSSGTEVSLGNNLIITHFHKKNNYELNNLLYFINTYGPGFYKFEVNAIRKDGALTSYLTETINIYDHMDEEIELKYNVNGFSEDSETQAQENYLYMYLERNGYYYIHINLPNFDYSEVILNIERVSVDEIEVASRFDEVFTETLVSSNSMTEYATGFSIDQTSVFTIDITTNQTYTGNITLILFRKAYNEDTKKYYIQEIIGDYIPLENDKSRKILVEGTYYIGFFGNTNNVPLTIKINRIVTTSEITDQVLVMDPSYSSTYGTEVRHNGGALEGITITEGFTRHVHFKNVTGVPSVSRYDYSYYSSNTSYATVSEFGTVFAKAVSQDREVTITAVYKNDPSIIFAIDLVIVNDTTNIQKVIETTQTIYLSDFVNGKYKLVLDENNSPYPWIQYYNWSVYVPCQENDILVTMDKFGYLTTSGAGSATLTGTYTINPNVTIKIHINFV